MTDERKQSPHYIPELDPDRPESGPKVKQRMLWVLIALALSSMAVGGVLLNVGAQTAGIVFIVIGVILLAPILFWIPF